MISFIIPAYNAQNTIERAVTGIADYVQDSEIIVVENGSTDNTTEIVERLQESYKNVRLIHSEKGVSKARNAALDIAAGEWVAFVDADDYLEQHRVDELNTNATEMTVDLWVYGHCAGKKEKGVTNENTAEVFTEESIEDARVRMLENPTRYMQVWAKLFKNSVIQENKLRFNERLRLSEDSDFTLRYSRVCKKICFSPAVIYHYSVDACSTMRSYDGEKAKLYVQAMKETGKSVAEESEKIKNAFQKYILIHMNIAMVREIFAVAIKRSAKARLADMNVLIKESVFKQAILGTSIKECLVPRMLPIFFLKLHLNVLAAGMYTLRAAQNAKRERKVGE